jgi:hypothetical protein
MEHDGQLQLYTAVANQLKEAHSRVRALQVPEAKHDLADAARRLDRFIADLEAGRIPEEDR